MVLWLTRTSMSDLPSVPSLKNLVTASVFGHQNSVKIKPHQKSTSEKNSSIQRNFSTKSFLKYEREDQAEPPLRKCETVIALSQMSSSSSTTSQKKPKKPESPMSVFKHLSNKVTKSSENGSASQGVTCESPYPVSFYRFQR